MQYRDIEGPNTMAQFFDELLSDDTVYQIYKDLVRTGNVVEGNDNSDPDPMQGMREVVRTSLYTAGYSMLFRVLDGEHNEERFETAVGR